VWEDPEAWGIGLKVLLFGLTVSSFRSTLGVKHEDRREAREIIKWYIHRLRRKVEPDPSRPIGLGLPFCVKVKMLQVYVLPGTAGLPVKQTQAY